MKPKKKKRKVVSGWIGSVVTAKWPGGPVKGLKLKFGKWKTCDDRKAGEPCDP